MTMEKPPGVSLDFFAGACKLLVEIHGKKLCSGPLEELRAGLAQAEAAFKQLEDVPEKETRKAGFVR